MKKLCLLGIVLLLAFLGSAVAATTADLLVPLGVAPFDFEFGRQYAFSAVDAWQGDYVFPPNSLIGLRFGSDQGASDYVHRLRLESDLVLLSVGDIVDTLSGAFGSGDMGIANYTYEGLVGKFGTGGTLIQPGRVLLETDPRFQASATPPEYFTTGYNPNAWADWLTSQDPTTGWYPITNRLMILPVTSNELLIGSSQRVLGFATFFIDRVWDGVTADPATGFVPARGDMQVRFVPEGMIEPIPEPSGLLVLGSGMLALAGVIRKTRRA